MTQILMVNQSELETIVQKIVKQTINQQPTLPERLNDQQAAEFLGCKVSYLAQLRHKRLIPYLRAGKFVSYNRSDLQAYLQRQPSRNELKENAMDLQLNPEDVRHSMAKITKR